MRIQLPDINILIAIHNSKHLHHDIATEWFETEGRHGRATCPLTENGFTRIFTQSQYLNSLQGVSSALFLLQNMVKAYSTTHHFWPDNVSMCDGTLFTPSAIEGRKQITDIYLLGLYNHNGGNFGDFRH